MELQHHQSGVLHGSALNTPSVGTPLEGSSQQRGVLQERSANWPHDNTASPLTDTQHAPHKLSRSQSPTENNAYSQQAAAVGNYFTGSLHAQHIGLAGCGVERSERQIAKDIKRLYNLLARSDKYQKYREKQPVLTPREFIEREAREAKMKVDKDNKSPEKSVWPEFLEHAFWRALIRWPPMGRKKFMLDGALRGRNELIQDSIYKDTGIRRDRKQVSSHLQVLKQHLKDQPGVLVYMATKDEDKKRHRGRETANSYHLSHLGGRHHPQQRMGANSKYDYSASAPFWSGLSSLQSSLGLNLNGASAIAPYAVTDFTMMVEDGDQHVHDFTQLIRDGRQPDLHVTDNTTWNRQYHEFAFLQKQADEWTRKCQKVLVCDASIKVMTETRPNAHLSIAFDLHSQRDLRPFESLVCTTRFYDDGQMDPDPQFDGSQHHDLKEHRTSCEYTPDPHGNTGKLRLAFGSRFWVNRMSKYQSLRHKDDSLVSRSLMKLTATQDVYGVSPSGAAECILTILWRFRQTRDSAEVGVMKWRAVSFGSLQTGLKQEWTKAESLSEIDSELLDIGNASAVGTAVNTDTLYPTHSLTHSSQHAQQQQQLSTQHLPYAVQHPSFSTNHTPQPPSLHIDTLHWPSTAPDLSTSASAAPSTATDHSFTSIPHLSHSQDTASGCDLNDFDFTGGRIDITGAFSPAIMAAYEASAADGVNVFGSSVSVGGQGSEALAALNVGALADQQALLDMGLTAQDIAGLGVGVGVDSAGLPLGAYGSGKNGGAGGGGAGGGWAAQMLESTGTGNGELSPHFTDDLVGHHTGLHSSTANLSTTSLWNLASPFHEDTSSGAPHSHLMGGAGTMNSGMNSNNMHGSGGMSSAGMMERKDSMAALAAHPGSAMANGLGLGVLDLIERDQRSRSGY
ncbi:hypothetical protein E8E13_000149 [Curvularia kusanoi]|uniref:TEA domain-containing protein n=1 Tax=Curvularia kusanoi TaxID=90978 RepID=A0A9P4W8E5_CURKU|nr:hypothetical protein E8E13_000149 [Curvularia kusanoi]